jgi:hypothetical protein
VALIRGDKEGGREGYGPPDRTAGKEGCPKLVPLGGNARGAIGHVQGEKVGKWGEGARDVLSEPCWIKWCQVGEWYI